MHQNGLGGWVKHRLLGPSPGVAKLAGLGFGPRMQLPGSGSADAAGRGPHLKNHCSRAIRKESGVLQTQGRRDGGVLPGGSPVSGREGPNSISGSRTASRCCFTRNPSGWEDAPSQKPASCTFHSGIPGSPRMTSSVLFYRKSSFFFHPDLQGFSPSLNRRAAFTRPCVADVACPPLSTLRNENTVTGENPIWTLHVSEVVEDGGAVSHPITLSAPMKSVNN